MAGYRHSAAVTEDGDIYTWGEGDYGRLGMNVQYFLTIPWSNQGNDFPDND